MNSDIRNEKFERERLEKQTICKMITLGIDPMHQKFLNEKASGIVDDFMNLLYDWGFVVVTEEKPFESSEDAENNKWFKINKGLFDSNNQMKKQMRRMDWQSKEGQIISAFSRKFLKLGVAPELSTESCFDEYKTV
jgi:hypothetical protein